MATTPPKNAVRPPTRENQPPQKRAALGAWAAYVKQAIRDKLIEHKQYIHRYGEEMPEISPWRWGASARGLVGSRSDTAADF